MPETAEPPAPDEASPRVSATRAGAGAATRRARALRIVEGDGLASDSAPTAEGAARALIAGGASSVAIVSSHVSAAGSGADAAAGSVLVSAGASASANATCATSEAPIARAPILSRDASPMPIEAT